MGEYINPKNTTKERFLAEYGRRIGSAGEAAADDEREVAEFTRTDDDRPRTWFAVKLDLLRPFMSSYALAAIGRPLPDLSVEP